MNRIKIAIVDDLQQDRTLLAEKIDSYMNEHHLQYQLFPFTCGEQFLAALDKEQFDIVFMDIYMQELNGIETAGRLRARDMDCKLIFLTSTEEYLRQSVSLNICHYLLKPVSDSDFVQAMENCRIQQPCQVPFLEISFSGQNLRLDTAKIMYVDICSRNAIIHTAKQDFPAGRNFHIIAEKLLADKRFISCIKGVVVNMDFISKQEDNAFLLSDGTRIPVALRGKKELLSHYRSYIFNSMGGKS